MAIKTREEIFATMKELLADNNSDLALQFTEDMTDTFADLTDKAKGDGIDWKAKYEENDKNWRDKYKDRFFNSEANPEPNPEPEPSKAETITYNDLFNSRNVVI